jgi:hypothetical protein
MLPPQCRWIESDGAAFLHWHFGCFATVKPDAGRYVVRIDWQGLTLTGRAGSLAQGRLHVERWVAHQQGPPGLRVRRKLPRHHRN